MTLAYGTIIKTETEFQIIIVASHAKQYPVGNRIGPFDSKGSARVHATLHGISVKLPTKAEMRASVSHHPYADNFFSAKLCRLHRDPAPMKVIRLEDGYIGLNNGRSTWLWSGNDLKRIPD